MRNEATQLCKKVMTFFFCCLQVVITLQNRSCQKLPVCVYSFAESKNETKAHRADESLKTSTESVSTNACHSSTSFYCLCTQQEILPRVLIDLLWGEWLTRCHL
ncbi:MAG: hypothetical protein LBC20_04250 [Planctomycetaceae bacterium]|nr:hypothetical protein [Planctomycetaceae bacterium]